MTTEQKTTCNATTWQGSRAYACSKRATIREDSAWWCTIHAPSYVAEKQRKREAKWDAERIAMAEKVIKLESDARKLAAFDELLAVCEAVLRLADGVMLPGPIYMSITERNDIRAAIAKARGAA